MCQSCLSLAVTSTTCVCLLTTCVCLHEHNMHMPPHISSLAVLAIHVLFMSYSCLIHVCAIHVCGLAIHVCLVCRCYSCLRLDRHSCRCYSSLPVLAIHVNVCVCAIHVCVFLSNVLRVPNKCLCVGN